MASAAATVTLPSPLPPPPSLASSIAESVMKTGPKIYAPVPTNPRSAGDYILMIINAVSVLLLLLGISFASVKVSDDGNTMFTPQILLTLFGFTVFFACVSLWFSEIDNSKIVFFISTLALGMSILMISSSIVRMHYHAST